MAYLFPKHLVHQLCHRINLRRNPCILTPVLWAAQLVKPVEASTEVLQDVHTQEYLDQLHSSSRKVCPAQGAWISIAA